MSVSTQDDKLILSNVTGLSSVTVTPILEDGSLDTPQVLDMANVTRQGTDTIVAGTPYTMSIVGAPFGGAWELFSNLNKPTLYNQLLIKAALNSGLTSVKGALYERRANRLNIAIDDDIDLTDYSVVNFAMFSLVNKHPTVLKSLNNGIQTSESTITVEILPEDNVEAGDYIIELTIGDESLVSIFVHKIEIRRTRL
jgi:hypothetical protein